MANPSASKSIPCPSCGASASGKFCNECGSSLVVPVCRNCATALPAGARFCNACGTPLGAAAPAAGRAGAGATTGAAPGAAPSGSLASYAPWGIAALGLVAVLAYFSGRGTGGTEGATPANGGLPPGAAPFAQGGGSGAAPDISNMSPRERAGRLYDRIMRYAEEGKRDSVLFFSPMAMASFEMLGEEMDLDARYDFGRVATEAGVFDVAAAQADTILMSAPTHLLGLSLAARAAQAQGNDALAQKSWKQFLASKDTELLKNLPEYQAHAGDIEAATRVAQGS